MVVVKPADPRAKIEESSRGLKIHIPTKKNIFMILFTTAWLGGWAIGEVMVFRLLLFGESPPFPANAFLIFWLVGWTIGGGWAIYSWFWTVKGVEIITLDSTYLTVKRDLFGFGKTKEYELQHIRNLRIGTASFNETGFGSWGNSGGTIAFDHGAKTIRFGSSIEEGEADIILSKMKEKYSFEG